MIDNYSGVLIIGHGTREDSSMQAYYDTVDLVRNMLPKTLVEGAYLEFAKPTIMEGIDLLIDQYLPL